MRATSSPPATPDRPDLVALPDWGGPIGLLAGDIALRRASIRHEGAVRLLGMVGYAAGLGCGAAALGVLAGVACGAARDGAPGRSLQAIGAGIGLGIGGFLAAGAVLAVALGRGLRCFEGWARRAAMGVAWVGLLGCALAAAALGTRGGGGSAWVGWAFVPGMALAATLNLLGSPRARAAFTPEYRDLARRTPHVAERPTPAVTFVLGAAVLVPTLLLLAVALATLLRPR